MKLRNKKLVKKILVKSRMKNMTMGIKPKNHGLKLNTLLMRKKVIEFDSINWYSTEYWLEVLKALN